MAKPNKNMFEMGTDFNDGWHADNKEKKRETCSKEIKAPEKHRLHFAKEKRRGKVVTIVKPFYLNEADLKKLLKQLKSKLGTGGTHKENTLEFQGELQEKLRTALEALGYRFKQ
jgi:translation initiation factor 1